MYVTHPPVDGHPLVEAAGPTEEVEQQPRRFACSPGLADLLDGRLIVDPILRAVEVDLRTHLGTALFQHTPLRSGSTIEALLQSILRLRVIVVLRGTL